MVRKMKPDFLPLRHGHINMQGHYIFTLAEQVTNGQLRPLKRKRHLSTVWPRIQDPVA